mmetsp:Transcript_20155/g.59784  ORF Transcript_20155/g.59784 Transcript_20155/m.59784 type:complete len:159 (-) Transcript_20155:155-631(-)
MGLTDQRRRRRMRDDIKRFRARQENADAKTTAQVKEVTEKGFALGDRLRGESKHEIERLTSQYKVELSLVDGKIREDLRKAQNTFSAKEAKLELDIGRLYTKIEASKNEMIRYTLGTIFSLTAVAFGIVRYATLSGSPRRDSALGEGVEGRALPLGER